MAFRITVITVGWARLASEDGSGAMRWGSDHSGAQKCSYQAWDDTGPQHTPETATLRATLSATLSECQAATSASRGQVACLPHPFVRSFKNSSAVSIAMTHAQCIKLKSTEEGTSGKKIQKPVFTLIPITQRN